MMVEAGLARFTPVVGLSPAREGNEQDGPSPSFLAEKAGEAVVANFFTLAATWYCVSGRDAIIKLLTAFTSEAKRDTARETYLAIDRRLGAYTRLRFLMVFAVGAVLSAGFYAIGLN